MHNIEIKAHYKNLDRAREIAKNMNCKFEGAHEQIDTYFVTKHGRLKLRESNMKPAELIPYKRPNTKGPKKSDYMVIKIDEPTRFKTLMAEILEVDVVVEKTREIYLYDNVRIHLDSVKNLGCFFEFEAVYSDSESEQSEKLKLQDLLSKFEIEEDDLLEGSYRELMRGK